MPIVLGWTRECRSVSSRIVPDKPVEQAGRCEAKQAKTPVSTLRFLFLHIGSGLRCSRHIGGQSPQNYYNLSFKSIGFIASLTLCVGAVETRTARSKVRRAGFALKVCNGAKTRVQVYLRGLALDDQLGDALSAKSRTRSPRRCRVNTVSVDNRSLNAACPLTLAGVQVMTFGRE